MRHYINKQTGEEYFLIAKGPRLNKYNNSTGDVISLFFKKKAYDNNQVIEDLNNFLIEINSEYLPLKFYNNGDIYISFDSKGTDKVDVEKKLENSAFFSRLIELVIENVSSIIDDIDYVLNENAGYVLNADKKYCLIDE